MNWLKWIQYIALYLSFLILPLLVFACWWVLVDFGWWSLLVLIITGMAFYMRFIEPYRILIRREKVLQRSRKSEKATLDKFPEGLKIVLLTDLHLGIFKGEKFFRKLLEKVIIEKPDLIILAGDLINDPTEKYLKKMFLPLKKIKIPIMAVTGNHDAAMPGDYLSERVRLELEKVKVLTIDNKRKRFKFAGKNIMISGLSDLSESKYEIDLLKENQKDDYNILIAHNPDMAYLLDKKLSIDLILSGHTHGGQIYLPPFSNWLIPCKYDFVRGWYVVKGRPVFVSSGLGEVILPMRFLLPPELVVLEF